MNYEAFADNNVPGDWRVEAIDFENEGNVYVAIFSGPEAQTRAEDYARWQNGIRQRKPALKAS
jgi:hypothetical protein